MSLEAYSSKRDFAQTPEPVAKGRGAGKTLRFVVQLHDASSLHFDFRLELEGVLKSWAVPKGPSLDPAEKRLAMMVEDHPLSYRNFEGVIPEGSYGAGAVVVWDEGTYEAVDGAGSGKKAQEVSLLEQLNKGNIQFRLHGKRLRGVFRLMRFAKGGPAAWLLVKAKDEAASKDDIAGEHSSVKTGRLLAAVATDTATSGSERRKARSVKDPTQPGNGKDGEELVVSGQPIQITNTGKLYWNKEGFTKGDMVRYYTDVLPFIFPYLRNRPQSLHRHPNGVGSTAFYQKDMLGKVPEWITLYEDFSESTGKAVHYLVCNHEAVVPYLANLGCIELHPFHSRVEAIGQPDYCVLDLDPHTGSSFGEVIETAQVVRKVLEAIGAKGYCKTSGSSGLHVYVPMGARYSYEAVKAFAEGLVTVVQQELPAITSLERNPAKRRKKIYLDWMQNTLTQTAACAYSLRPKPGMPVSTPLHWDEVRKGLKPATWNARNIRDRLRAEGDLFAPVLGKGVNLKQVSARLNALIKSSS